MSWVKAKPGENIESLLKRFKKAVERSGILGDLKKNEYYEKPSVQKKRKQAAARKRALKREKKLARLAARKGKNKNFKWNKDRTKKIPMPPPKKMANKTKDFKRDFNKKHGPSKPGGKPTRSNYAKKGNKS